MERWNFSVLFLIFLVYLLFLQNKVLMEVFRNILNYTVVYILCYGELQKQSTKHSTGKEG